MRRHIGRLCCDRRLWGRSHRATDVAEMRFCRWCMSYPVGDEHTCRGLVEAKKTEQRISDDAERKARVRFTTLSALARDVSAAAKVDDGYRRLERWLRVILPQQTGACSGQGVGVT